MITYRQATKSDAPAIASLHTKSWQLHYRNILKDIYLDTELERQKLSLWKRRLYHHSEEQFVLVAESDKNIIGFACNYLNYDPVWGTLLDNLHVDYNWKGQGIGKVLLRQSAQFVYDKLPTSFLHLWVYEANSKAILFYEKLGGICKQTKWHQNPDGGEAKARMYVWEDIPALIQVSSNSSRD